MEKQAEVMFSISYLESKGLIQKSRYDEQAQQYRFCLTDETRVALDKLLKQYKGNRSLACVFLIMGQCTSEGNPLSLEAITVHMEVLHALAFGEEADPKDAEHLKDL